MIRFTTGDILTADVEAMVNTVNCVGIMGRGVALQFKNAFPNNFKAYAVACKAGEVVPGRMFVYERRTVTNPRYVVNFPTKRHWRGKSRMEDVESGLSALASEIRARNIRSIAIPPLGSGLGGLEWSDVRQRIVAALSALKDVDILVFEPSGAPAPATKSSSVPDMTPGRAALVALSQRYLAGLMDPFVSLLEMHKLMYFMQVAGQPLKLQFVKGAYGPYSENLRHVLNAIEGHLISGYGDGGDDPRKPLRLVPGAVRDAEAFLADKADTLARFDRVAELVEGFETPFGLELLATVHWVADNEGAAAPDDIERAVYAWNERKRQFTPRQIGIAFDTLQKRDWLGPSGHA